MQNKVFHRDNETSLIELVYKSEKVYCLIDTKDHKKVSSRNWHVSKKKGNYYVQSAKRPKIFLHRFLLSPTAEQFVDHINHDTLDNRRDNIRKVTPQQNSHNREKSYERFSSSYKGVSWDRKSKKWRASIRFNNIAMYIGLFEEEIQAAISYDLWARDLFGDFAYLNFKSAI